MRYTITIREKDYEALLAHLLADRLVERAAYLFCRFSTTDSETRLLVSEIKPIQNNEVASSSASGMSITSTSLARALKYGKSTGQGFIFVHSHPEGFAKHSEQDNKEEVVLFKTVHERIESDVHGSIVISNPTIPSGRVWHKDGTTSPVSLIRVIGDRFSFFYNGEDGEEVSGIFDRQIRAFGPDIQKILTKLTVGIIGVGGTGSSVAEQLMRLGVKNLFIADGDTFEDTNVNRVYGSVLSDKGKKKVNITKRLADSIGLGTIITAYDKPITYENVIKHFRNCDIIFGCTDDEWGRSLLTRFAIYYGIPVFDMGVKIDSSDGVIKSIQGRVTTLMPGESCLFCRGRLNPDKIRAESLEAVDPEAAARQRDEGYVLGLAHNAPAVITFTTSTAATAISELLHRLTGCFGGERASSETTHMFDQTRMGTNRTPQTEDCFCVKPQNIHRGDVQPFLNTSWRNE